MWPISMAKKMCDYFNKNRTAKMYKLMAGLTNIFPQENVIPCIETLLWYLCTKQSKNPFEFR